MPSLKSLIGDIGKEKEPIKFSSTKKQDDWEDAMDRWEVKYEKWLNKAMNDDVAPKLKQSAQNKLKQSNACIWTPTMDEVTCEICEDMAGDIFDCKPGSAVELGLSPHGNTCRCTLEQV